MSIVDEYRGVLSLISRLDTADPFPDQGIVDEAVALESDLLKRIRHQAVSAHGIDPASAVTRPVATWLDGRLIVVAPEPGDATRDSAFVLDPADILADAWLPPARQRSGRPSARPFARLEGRDAPRAV